MARICVLAPGQPSVDPRLVKEADALHEAGHEVQVALRTYDRLGRPGQIGSSSRRRALDVHLCRAATQPESRNLRLGPPAPRLSSVALPGSGA